MAIPCSHLGVVPMTFNCIARTAAQARSANGVPAARSFQGSRTAVIEKASLPTAIFVRELFAALHERKI